jgi:hypothetical protein
MNERYGQHETARDGFNAGYRPDRHAPAPESAQTVRLASHKPAVRLEILNTLNINTVTSVTRQSGATFCQPTAIVPGRNVQVGFTYSF